jgi:hypothetical protein
MPNGNGIVLNSADWSFLSTGQPPYTRLAQAAASASYGSVAPTSTRPSSNVIYEFTTDCPSLIRIMPYSTVNNATGVGMRVVGWTSALLPKYYTNLITYSEEFDNAAWIKSFLAVTGGSINASVAPDGTTTADNVLETGASQNHYIGRDLGAPGASTDIRTHSVYVKGGLGRQYASITAANSSGGPYYTVTVDLNTGSITQSDLVNTATWFTTTPTATVTSVGNSWYRVAITCRQVQYLLMSPNTTGTPVSGSGWGLGTYTSDLTKGIVVWGGQVEWGTSASPYVKTVASTVQAIDTLTSPTKFYFSTVLADFTLTYSTGTVPSATVNNVPNYLFSTASQVAISPDASIYRPSTVTATNVELASVLVDAIGHELIELQFKANSGSMGALWATI